MSGNNRFSNFWRLECTFWQSSLAYATFPGLVTLPKYSKTVAEQFKSPKIKEREIWIPVCSPKYNQLDIGQGEAFPRLVRWNVPCDRMSISSEILGSGD